jgi:hypothetical protein
MGTWKGPANTLNPIRVERGDARIKATPAPIGPNTNKCLPSRDLLEKQGAQYSRFDNAICMGA